MSKKIPLNVLIIMGAAFFLCKYAIIIGIVVWCAVNGPEFIIAPILVVAAHRFIEKNQKYL